MSTVSKIIIYVISAMLLLAGLYLLFSYYQSLKEPGSSDLDAISPETVFFVQSDDIRHSLFNLTKETDFWPEVEKNKLLLQFSGQFQYLDSLITSSNELSRIIDEEKFTLIFDKTDTANYGFIFVQKLTAGDIVHEIRSFIRNVNGENSILMSYEHEKAEIHIVNFSSLDRLFYYAVYNGLFIGSFEEMLVKKTINTIQADKPVTNDPYFNKISGTAGKNVEGNVYLHFKNFATWLSTELSESYNDEADLLGNLAYWMETDLLINKEDILLSGYSIIKDDSYSGLSDFRQEPQLIKVPEILPHDIVYILHFGLENMKQFFSSGNKKKKYNDLVEYYNKTFGVDLEENFLGWLGNEAALAGTYDQMTNNRSLIVLQSNDIVKALLSLGNLEKKINDVIGARDISTSYNEYTIHKIHLPKVFRVLLGVFFPEKDNYYYTSIKDFIVFADNSNDIKYIIDQFYKRKTLSKNQNYISFSDNISDRSNIYFYGDLKKISEKVPGMLKSNLSSSVSDFFKSFESLAIQFSFINNMFYTNLFLRYNPEIRDFTPKNWETQLDANVHGTPVMVKNHRNNRKNLIIFDDAKTMYLLDHVGTIQWKLPLVELPSEIIHTIDYYNNEKLQYLFNTENYLYIVDLNGNYVAEYPVKLPSPSSNAISVFDYNNDGNYRLLLALDDNKLYNFNSEAVVVEGWHKPQANERIVGPVQHFVRGGKDYLLASDKKGNVLITDRRGNIRIKTKKNVEKARNSIFYLNKTNSKGLFISTDTKGRLVYIGENGNIKRTKFSDFGPDHFFFYDDFDNDDSFDFIYVENNVISVYDRFKKTICEYQLPEPVATKPLLFNWGKGKYLGILLSSRKEIWIYDYQGRRFENQLIRGTTSFTTGSLNNDNKLNLITGFDGKIINYQLN